MRQALELDQLGMAGMLLGAGEATQVQAVVVGVTEVGAGGIIVALEGSIEIERLVRIASSLGVSDISAGPEMHQEFQLWSGEAFGLIALALAGVDETTMVMSQAEVGSGSDATDQVRGALDAFAGESPRLLDDPGLAALVNNMPSGVITTLFEDCAPLENLSIVEDVSGCVGHKIWAIRALG